DAEVRELLLELRRHGLTRRLADVHAELGLEAVPPRAVGAAGEVRLSLLPLAVRQLAVEVRLEQLLALVAICDHVTASSANCFFRIRRPRCSRDITVPMGM